MPGHFSVRKKWHLKALISSEEHTPSNRSSSEPIAQVVERGVEGVAGVRIERERQLDGVIVVEVGK